MTMPYASHPDDERLAAYADGEADALQDRALSVHISTCDRCAPIVEDLTALPSLLGALPDIVPSRPLRLIPPVPESASRPAEGPMGWLRRLSGPAFAAGSGLVLVGAIGASGVVGLLPGAASQAAPDYLASDELGPGMQSSKEQASSQDVAVESSGGQPLASSGDTTNRDATGFEQFGESNIAWLVVLGIGLALVLGAVVLRFSLQPRAG